MGRAEKPPESLSQFTPDIFPEQARERFWSQSDRRSGECWIWTGRQSSAGYGVLTRRERPYLAHRAAYYLCHGVDPGEKQVCHTCDNRLCVRPDHLFLGTRQDNMDDMVAKGRSKKWDGERVGGANPNAKLTADDVRAIRAARNAGNSPGAIASLYGVSNDAVNDIIRGRRWGGVR